MAWIGPALRLLGEVALWVGIDAGLNKLAEAGSSSEIPNLVLTNSQKDAINDARGKDEKELPGAEKLRRLIELSDPLYQSLLTYKNFIERGILPDETQTSMSEDDFLSLMEDVFGAEELENVMVARGILSYCQSADCDVEEVFYLIANLLTGDKFEQSWPMLRRMFVDNIPAHLEPAYAARGLCILYSDAVMEYLDDSEALNGETYAASGAHSKF